MPSPSTAALRSMLSTPLTLEERPLDRPRTLKDEAGAVASALALTKELGLKPNVTVMVESGGRENPGAATAVANLRGQSPQQKKSRAATLQVDSTKVQGESTRSQSCKSKQLQFNSKVESQ